MSEKMREEFENAWLVANGFSIDCETFLVREAAWLAWRLSRESLVVDFTYCVLPHDFVEAAKDAGLKVKP